MRKILKLMVLLTALFLPAGIHVYAEEAGGLSTTTTVEIQADAKSTVSVAAEDGAPQPSTLLLQVPEGGKASFTITFTEPGNYRYDITRTDTKAFDTYHLEVHVFNEDDGTLSATQVIQYGDSKDKSSIITFNTEKPKETPPVTVPPKQTPPENKPPIRIIPPREMIDTGAGQAVLIAGAGAAAIIVILIVLVKKKKKMG